MASSWTQRANPTPDKDAWAYRRGYARNLEIRLLVHQTIAAWNSEYGVTIAQMTDQRGVWTQVGNP